MRRSILCLALLLVIGMTPMAMADNDHRDHRFWVRTHLSGFNEVHFAGGSAGPPFVPATLRGAVSTGASGKFVATIDEKDRKIHYKLSYKDLEGTVTQGHIHFGQRHTVGGIVVWLCQTADMPAPAAVAAATPFCPAEGIVEGTITPAKVLAQTLQGFAGNSEELFGKLVDAIRAGTTYANVHTTLFTPGEIRGQIPGSHDD